MLLQADSTRESVVGLDVGAGERFTDAGDAEIIFFSSVSGNTARFVEKLEKKMISASPASVNRSPAPTSRPTTDSRVESA
jgi:hypothetical protein